MLTVEIATPCLPAGNPAFDVIPGCFVTGFITEGGNCEASTEGLLKLYP